MTSENTEDQESRSWSHANMHHANVVLSFQIRPCCIEQYIQISLFKECVILDRALEEMQKESIILA
uniref:Uncharacterized protein n=1 Tax=Oryza meridionalis TaxID=40149 RepID=A0A0E0E030_9ORYZ